MFTYLQFVVDERLDGLPIGVKAVVYAALSLQIGIAMLAMGDIQFGADWREEETSPN